MGVSKKNGTPKSSIFIGFSIINHPFGVSLFLETSKFEQCSVHPGWLFIKDLRQSPLIWGLFLSQ